MTARAETWVAGVDGCRSGWICALMQVSEGRPMYGELRFAMDFGRVLGLIPSPAVIAIDMPIGLPERTAPGGRPPERAVRGLLGERQSSVFAIPSRDAVYAKDYRDACRIAMETSDPPRKVSKQAFHIFPKIRDIDALMTPQLQARVFECHPEVALAQANGAPAALPKKVLSRPNPIGVEWRIDLLKARGIPEKLFTDALPRGIGHGRDDIADAAACALTAWRILEGRAVRYPAEPVRDGRGLDMAIWA